MYDSLAACRVHLLSALAVVALAGAVDAARGQDQAMFVLTNEQFDTWLTNNNTRWDEQFNSHLKMQMLALDRTCRLTDGQQERLELAARGDARRFQAEVDRLRAELVDKSYDQNEISDVYQRIQPLQQKFQTGLLGEQSLFRKIVDRTLNEEQLIEYEAAQARRRAARYRACILAYVASLDRVAAMEQRQREALVALFEETTTPPKRFGQHDVYYAMYQASRLPQGRLNDIFDEAQLKVVQAAFRQGAGYEHMLRQQGFLPEDEEQRRAPAAAVPATGDE